MESDVLEQLYRQYHRQLLLYCMALTGSREEAEDLAADTFVKAYLCLPREIPSFFYWLLRVAKNLWIDRLRHRKYNAEQKDDEQEWTWDGPSPEQELLTRERSRTLFRSMQCLCPEERELVTLYYFFEWELGRIAQLQNISYSAVRQRLCRARKKLKKQMEANGYDF